MWTPFPNELDYYLSKVNGKKNALLSMESPVSKEKEIAGMVVLIKA